MTLPEPGTDKRRVPRSAPSSLPLRARRVAPGAVAAAAAVILALLMPAPGAAAERPSVAARRAVEGAPHVDGHLDDAAWELATPARGLVQKEPAPGKPASEA